MVENGILLAVFNSAHRVMKAENILKKSDITMRLIPAPRALATDCGLAICFSSENQDLVLQSLGSESILPDIIYRKVSDSLYEPIYRSKIIDSDNSAKAA